MSATAVREAFRDKIDAIVTATLGALGWTFPGDTNDEVRPDAATKWITLEFVGGQEKIIGRAPSSTRYRENGAVFVDLHTQAGSGNSEAEAAAEVIRAAFRGWKDGSVDLRVFEVDAAQMNVGQSATVRAAVHVPYQYDHFA